MSDISQLTVSAKIEQLRARLHAMSNRELRDFGTAVRHKHSQSIPGDPQSVEFDIQLEEAVAEWRRRYPKKTKRRLDKKEHTDAE